MVKEWLTRPMTVAEAEQANPLQPSKPGADVKAFGRLDAQWQELLSAKQPGDEIWEFRSPPDTWRMLMGRAGVALVRNGEIVVAIVTIMN